VKIEVKDRVKYLNTRDAKVNHLVKPLKGIVESLGNYEGNEVAGVLFDDGQNFTVLISDLTLDFLS
jgi:hypothetical protein